MISEASRPFSSDGEIVSIGLSVGLATSTQVNAKMTVTVDLLSRVTDFALYESKSNGRNQFTIYDHAIEQRFLDRRAMLEELPRAIADRDLEVHLQLKVFLADQSVYGFEALVRWRRDGRLSPPGEFILIAEESGLVIDIDNFVLRTATQLVADWNRDHATEYSISVNLSTLHFNSKRVIEAVQDSLWQSGLPPSLLILEITETMEIRDWDKARGIIKGLRNLGCKIAIDDFGTGFSSLAYLRSMPANELKVDKSLIDDLETSEKARLLLTSVLDIAGNLSLAVTVEGIETNSQFQIALEMGVPHGQGYFFGRPLPAEQALRAAKMDTAPFEYGVPLVS